MTQALEKTFNGVETTDKYLESLFGAPRNDQNAQQWDRKRDEMDREARVRTSLMSPAKTMGLPGLLDERRLEWLITDGAFSHAPLFNRVYVHQIPRFVNKKKGLIHMPDTKASQELRSCHRGIIVGAGCLALDALRSNGVDLGHIVNFLHVNPFRIFVDYAEGFEMQVLSMTVDCIADSEDLADTLRSKVASVQIVDGKHQISDAEGKLWDPRMPEGTEVW